MRMSPHQGLSFLQDGDGLWPESIWLSPLAYFCCRTSLFFFCLFAPTTEPTSRLRPCHIRQPWDLHTLKCLPGGQLPKSISMGGWHFLIIATIMAITAWNPVCLVSTGVVLMSCKFQCVIQLGIPQRWEVQQAYKILRKTIYQLFAKILLWR